MKWAGHVARTEQLRNEYKTSVGKLEGKRPLGEVVFRCRWEDNIKMYLKEIGCQLDGTGSENAQWWALMKKVTKLRAP
jgi:hypothetical protein